MYEDLSGLWAMVREEVAKRGLQPDFHKPDWSGDHMLFAGSPSFARYGIHIRRSNWYVELGFECKERWRKEAALEKIRRNLDQLEEATGEALIVESNATSRRGRVRTALYSERNPTAMAAKLARMRSALDPLLAEMAARSGLEPETS